MCDYNAFCYATPPSTPLPCVFPLRLPSFFSLPSLNYFLQLLQRQKKNQKKTNKTIILVSFQSRYFFPQLQRKSRPRRFCRCRFHVSFFYFILFYLFFIVIQKGTLNFSLWKCIVCWMVGVFVPRGVENNTTSQHREKYYCQIFWDAVSLSIRSASMWSHGVF